MRYAFRGVDTTIRDGILETMRQCKTRENLNNGGYAFREPSNPFEDGGRPGYEAQDREFQAFWDTTAVSPEENINSND